MLVLSLLPDSGHTASRIELVTLSPTYIRGECRYPDMVYERSGGKHVVDPSA